MDKSKGEKTLDTILKKTLQVPGSSPIVSETETTQTVKDVNNQEVVVQKRRKPTNPWQPANRIAVKAKNPKELRVRGVNKRYRDGERVEKHLAEGWVMARPEHLLVGGAPPRGIDDGSGKGNGDISIGDLVYMVMPQEVGKQRDQFYAEETAYRTNSGLENYRTSTRGSGHAERIDRKVTVGNPDGSSRYVPDK